ncbi:MAG: manganese efflux pump MntP family protein [Atopobiaceae bacterium]|nr:manganese efflux pump MntP family protein [Atopobiaceae bacterium]MCH4180970.1 manganese efflux pump MntP family protein [Atopobiaceae bacterium]MCH4215144.1 manganese efflux pump MntP family protein [Atopobiaceae bacterium]MCH4230246.1 manganese efflux pump MntP family protein [Atopobiaceae bacterium]MCH4276707.1 manganese efflux pump MntP family protein [Atopobiaceae bacterium]
MSVIELVVLGVALACDAFAVTISNTFVYCHETRARLALMPILFGLFQGLMPLLGYVLGGLAAQLIEEYAGIVTLVILGIIGGNMIREGVGALRHPDRAEQADSCVTSRLTIPALLFQAVATAIDAFAVGVSLRAQTVDIVLAAAIIALTTAACCVVALVVGRKLGHLLGDRAEVAGGVVLVAIGLKAFLS